MYIWGWFAMSGRGSVFLLTKVSQFFLQLRCWTQRPNGIYFQGQGILVIIRNIQGGTHTKYPIVSYLFFKFHMFLSTIFVKLKF